MKQLSVTVIIPTFNGKHLLQKNLSSVVAALQAGDEICIVDDASTDGTQEWITKHCVPENVASGVHIYCVRNEQNLRFAASVNTGVAQAAHPLIFLCNNDVAVTENCIAALKQHFSDPTVFAVSCLEHEQELSGEWSGKNCLWFSRGLFQHSKAATPEFGDTAWASGGSALFSKEKWNVLGGFDTHFYPAYWEDIDLSYRARQRGWKILFEPEAVVIHKHESTHESVFGEKQIQKMSWKNALYFTRKHAAAVQLLQYYLWYPYWWWKRRSH